MTALRTNFNAGDNFTHDDANQAGINVNGATLTGTFSAMPTAGQPSRLYYCTDTDAVYRDDGSTWTRIRFGQNDDGHQHSDGGQRRLSNGRRG